MPLSFAPKNIILKISKVLLNDERTKRHLENLGILVNSDIMVISETNGNIIVKVKEGRIAINKDIAKKILVA